MIKPVDQWSELDIYRLAGRLDGFFDSIKSADRVPAHSALVDASELLRALWQARQSGLTVAKTAVEQMEEERERAMAAVKELTERNRAGLDAWAIKYRNVDQAYQALSKDHNALIELYNATRDKLAALEVKEEKKDD